MFAKPYHLNPAKCFIVENCFRPKERLAQQDPTLNREKGRTLLGFREKVFVGGTRELQWKNIPRVKEAFARVERKGVPASLDLRTGSREAFLSRLQSSYAVIIASLGDISPNTILEAISLGKPFILTRETGLYEKLKDIGVWVNPEDVNDIAAKILWLADERNYKMQCEKVKAFSFTHSYEEIAKEILDIYARA